MTVAEERMKVLQMLEEGKISAEEATGLLRALDGGRRAAPGGPMTLGESARYLRVEVTDLDTGARKVNVTLPFGLVRAGLRMAERFAPELEGLDLDELQAMITSETAGKVVEVTDSEDHERVEIYVE
jgi:hypothetical protein